MDSVDSMILYSGVKCKLTISLHGDTLKLYGFREMANSLARGESLGVRRATGIFWRNPVRVWTRQTLNFSREELSLLMEIVTGYSTLRVHLHRISRAKTRVCRDRGQITIL